MEMIIPLVVIFVLSALVSGVGFAFPFSVDDHFKKTYGERVLSKKHAVFQGISFVWGLYEFFIGSTLPTVLAIAAVVVSYGLGIRRCMSIAQNHGAARKEVKIAVMAQIAFSMGIAVAIVYNIFLATSKKDKRRIRW